VKENAGNPNVVFGDVNLAQAPGTGSRWSPGAGGWPTVRYFNSGTGYEGSPYKKKTSKAMCDELGDITMMRDYVTEMATPPCHIGDGTDVDPSTNCNEQELSFISTWRSKNNEEHEKELTRLNKMLSSSKNSLKPAQLAWLNQRIAILKQFTSTSTSGTAKEL